MISSTGWDDISIPAFREEGDLLGDDVLPVVFDISIPAFREEGDNAVYDRDESECKFQSPPSVRKATKGDTYETPFYKISIPAFREEGDPKG